MKHLDLLKRFGLTEYEARVYLALAKLGPSNVKNIITESKLPRNKAYEVLTKLEDKSLVEELPISPKRYRLTGVDLLKEEIDDMQNSFNSLKALVDNPVNNEFNEMFWVIKGHKAIADKLASTNKITHKEILAANNLRTVFYKNIRELKNAVERGVKVKMICQFDPKYIKSYKEYMATGAEIRVFNTEKFGPLLPRISVNDDKYARLTIGRPEVVKDEDYLSLWTESCAFANMLKTHFMNMWEHCRPIEEYIKNEENKEVNLKLDNFL